MVDNIKHISDNWQENTTIDVLQEMTMLAMGVMSESLDLLCNRQDYSYISLFLAVIS